MSTDRVIIGPDTLNRWFAIDDGHIAETGTGTPPAGRRLDCARSIITEGRVNAHTHLYSGLAPLGMPAPTPPPESFVQILERVWWRLDRALDADSLRAAARLYVAEGLLNGTTGLIDHHESPCFIEGSLDVLADACNDLGMRAVLCYGATERNEGRDEARRGLAECRRLVETNRRPLVRGAVALHASFTVSDDTIREAATLCRALDAPMHVHVAEDGADVDDAVQRGYRGPLERLLDMGALPEGSIVAHGVALTEDQVRLAAERGLWIVQNPRSNRGNRVGYSRYVGASDRVALGTDGYPADMLSELRALAEDARAYEGRDAPILRRADASGVLLAGLFKSHYGLDAGCPADLLVTKDGAVRHVVVGGRIVMEDGHLTTGDITKIREEAARQATLLWERMARL